MEPDAYRRLMQVFDAICDHPLAGRRERLRELCEGDEELLAAVQRMVAEDERSEILLDEVPAGGAAEVLAKSILQDTLSGGAVPHGAGAEISESLGPYRIVRRLGTGGMGTVYEVEQEDPQRRVALKVLHPWRMAAGEKLRFEAHALAQLLHPGIPQIYAVGETEGRFWLAMELVDGQRLTDYAAGLDDPQKVELLATIADAVHHAHLRGFAHLDLKPGNILVTAEGQPKVLDFGIARALRAPSAEERTRFEIAGTPPYMSPEQMSGGAASEGGIDARADVYALGVVAYGLLAGQLPWRIKGIPVQTAMARVLTEEPAPLGEVAPRLRGDLHCIVHRAIARAPDDRYPSADAMAEDLRRHLRHEPIRARPPTPLYVIGRFIQRHRLGVGAAAAVFAALVIGAVVSFGLFLAAERARAEAEAEAGKAQAIRGFLETMLTQANPAATAGAELTVRQVLDDVALRIGPELGDEPEVETAIRQTVGMTYGLMGLYEQALEQLLEAHRIAAAEFGDESPEATAALLDLSYYQRRYGGAARSTELTAVAEALEATLGRLRTEGGSTTDLPRALHILGQVRFDLGELETAESLLREALALHRQGNGRMQDEVQVDVQGHVETLEDLASLLLRNGKLEEAEVAHREAIGLLEQIGEAESAPMAATLNNLAVVLKRRGRLEEALENYSRGLSLSRQLHGDEHPAVASAAMNLGRLYSEMDRPDDAEPLLRLAVDLHRALFPPQDIRLAMAIDRLAGFLVTRGELAAAERLYQEVEETFRSQLGEDHPFYATLLLSLSTLHVSQGDAGSAEESARKALESYRSSYGDRHHYVAIALRGLGRAQVLAGDAEAAERSFRQSLATMEEGVGKKHPDLVPTLSDLALLAMERRDWEEAVGLMRRLLEVARAKFPEESRVLANYQGRLGEALAGQGDQAEAERLLLDSYRRLVATAGPEHAWTTRVRNALAELYRSSGRAEEARRLMSPQ